MQVVVVEFQRVQAQSLESFLVHRLQVRSGDLDVSNVGLRKVCKGTEEAKSGKARRQNDPKVALPCAEK